MILIIVFIIIWIKTYDNKKKNYNKDYKQYQKDDEPKQLDIINKKEIPFISNNKYQRLMREIKKIKKNINNISQNINDNNNMILKKYDILCDLIKSFQKEKSNDNRKSINLDETMFNIFMSNP